MTPDLAIGTPNYATFRALHRRFLALNIQSVECVILSMEEASIWIKRKHYKGMGGAGVVPWNAVATARSDASEGRFTRWMIALAYLEEQGIDAEDIRDSIARKTTTVERVLTSSYISSNLGLIFEKEGTLTPENGDTAGAVKLVNAILEDMSEKTFVETKVSSAEQQLEFLEKFADLSVKKMPTPTSPGTPHSGAPSTQPTASSLPSLPSGGAKTGPQTAPASAVSSTTVSRSRPVTVRKKLAKAGLRISN